MKNESLKKGSLKNESLKGLLLAISISWVSCTHSTAINGELIPSPDPKVNWSCEGRASYWSDTGPGPDSVRMTALWYRAADSSMAELRTRIKLLYDSTDTPDSIFLIHDSLRWHFAPNDSRAQYGWDPDIRETNDSLIFSMGFGFSGETYYLKKIN
jgi:hypothetical protein